MQQNIETLISTEDINKRVKELAADIKQDFNDQAYCVVVLSGAMIFFVDLMRELKQLNTDVTYKPIKISSYEGKTSTGNINLELDIKDDITDKEILIVEDLVDSGLTLKYLKEHLLERKAKDVKICALLDKKEKRKEYIHIDYKGFEVGDRFIVGYGMDYNERYRDLDYIGCIE